MPSVIIWKWQMFEQYTKVHIKIAHVL